MKKFIIFICSLFAVAMLWGQAPTTRELIDGILAHQMPDGAINMSAGSDQVWINPYFNSIAVYTLLYCTEQFPEKREAIMRFAENWFDWYCAHQKSNGIIDDYRGTLASYSSTNEHDSTDSYAAMYLVALEKYLELGGKADKALRRGARKAYQAILLTYEPDGLTFAKPTYAAKYLMDNIEVNYGLQSAERLFRKWGDAQLAAKAGSYLSKNYTGLQKFILKDEDFFAFALTGKDEDVCHKGFSKYYPDLMVNVFAALAYPAPPKNLWQLISGKTDVLAENVCSRAYSAAMRKKDAALAEAIRQSSEKRLENIASLPGMRLDLLYDSLMIRIDKGDFWPTIQK